MVTTAKQLFLEQGYNVTSLEKVATEAGFSKGAVYSNFGTKYELGLAVLDAVREDRVVSLAAAIDGLTEVEEQLDAFAVWADANIGDVGWTTLEVEFATSNRHVAGATAQLAERRRAVTAAIADLIERQAADLGLTLPMPAEDAAVTLLSLGIGLGVQRAFDPELPITSLVDLLRQLYVRQPAPQRHE
nr:TetR/AcrR family transcriptional regulator [Nocardioides thalensis]